MEYHIGISKKIVMLFGVISVFSLQSTIAVIVSNCNIESKCIEGSQCQNVCRFSGINTIGDMVKIPVGTDVIKKTLGTITHVTANTIQFQKKDWKTELAYVPTQGHMAEKSVSLLFYNIDTQNTAQLEMLPKKMRESIKKYQQNEPAIRYALFILKKVRSTIWQEIFEVYLAESSPDNVSVPVTIYPDGNMQIITPTGETAGEATYVRIDQMS